MYYCEKIRESQVVFPFLSDVEGSINVIAAQPGRGFVDGDADSMITSIQNGLMTPASVVVLDAIDAFFPPGWPQDRLLVRDATDYSMIAVNHASNVDMFTSRYYRGQSQITRFNRVRWTHEDERFPSEGGNMHVCGNIVFMGKDDKIKHQSESDILQHVLGSPDTGRVIWIGSSHPGSDDHRSNSSYQPAYHTDMFFCPISFDGRTLRFVFALPDNACLFSGNRVVDSLGALEKRFGDTLDNLTRDLRAIGITPDPIRIQLPVYYGNTRLEQYWCHANGLVENVDGITRYWMPCYSERSAMSENDWPRLLEIQDSNRSVLQDQGIEVVDIPGFEIDGDRTASLRCKVKVLHRSY
jgi:hypothetical protein